MPLIKQTANVVRALVLPLCIASSMIGTALDTSFSHPNPFKRHLEVFYYTRNDLKSQAHLNMFHAQLHSPRGHEVALENATAGASVGVMQRTRGVE